MYKIPKNLTPSEINFLVIWGIGSKSLTDYLRGFDKIPIQMKNYYNKYIHNLNTAINKYANIKFNTILHRRVIGDFYIADVGEVGTFETPISTTFNENAIEDYGEFHIIILAPLVQMEHILKELWVTKAKIIILTNGYCQSILDIKHCTKIMGAKRQ